MFQKSFLKIGECAISLFGFQFPIPGYFLAMESGAVQVQSSLDLTQVLFPTFPALFNSISGLCNLVKMVMKKGNFWVLHQAKGGEGPNQILKFH